MRAPSTTLLARAAFALAPATFLTPALHAQGTPPESLVLATGDLIPGIPGALVDDFTALGTSPGGDAIVRLRLAGPGITTANDTALAVIPTLGALRVVAREGDIVPTPLGTAVVGNFQGAIADASGALTFEALLTPTQGGNASLALLRERINASTLPGLDVLAQAGGPTPLGAPFTVLQYRAIYAVSRDGAVAAVSTLTGPGVTPANAYTVFYHPPGDATGTVLVRASQPLPLVGPTSTFAAPGGNFFTPAIPGRNGLIALPARTSSPAADVMIVGTLPIDAAPVVLRPDNSTGLPPGVFVQSVQQPNVVISQDNSVAFVAVLGGLLPAAFYVDRSAAAPAPVLLAGQPAPGMPAGWTLSPSGGLFTNIADGGSGWFALNVSLTRSNPPSSTFALYAIAPDNTPRLVAFNGMQIPQGLISGIGQGPTGPNNSAGVDADGRVVFTAQITPLAGVPYTAVLLSVPGRNLPVVVRAGSGLSSVRNRSGAVVPVMSVAVSAVPDNLPYSNQTISDASTYHVLVSNGTLTPFFRGLLRVEATPCNDLDFNNDGVFPDDADVRDFLAVSAGGPCPTSTCDSPDFNNDGVFPDDADLTSFLQVFSGGSC